MDYGSERVFPLLGGFPLAPDEGGKPVELQQECTTLYLYSSSSMYSQRIQQILDRSDIFANPALGQLNSCFFFPFSRSRLKIWSRETGSVVPFRISPLILHTQAESDWLMVLTHGLSRFPRQRPSVLQYTTVYHTYLSNGQPGHSRVYQVTQFAYRWRSPPRVHRYRASSHIPQGSLSSGCCLFR